MRLYGLPTRSPDTIDFYGDEDVYNALMSRHAERLMDVDIDEIDCASYVPNAEELLIEAAVFRVEQGSVLRAEREREEEQRAREEAQRLREHRLARIAEVERARASHGSELAARRAAEAEASRQWMQAAEEHARRANAEWQEHHETHIMRGHARNLAADRADGLFPRPGSTVDRIRLIARTLHLTEGEQGFFVEKKDDGFWYLLGSIEESAHRLRYTKGSASLDETLTILEAWLSNYAVVPRHKLTRIS